MRAPTSSKPELHIYVVVSPTEFPVFTNTIPLTGSVRSGHSAMAREYNIEKEQHENIHVTTVLKIPCVQTGLPHFSGKQYWN